MKVSNKCIFCLKPTDDNNSSVEHVLPDALGGNLLLPKHYCCKECNSTLGAKIDAKIVDIFQSARVLWNIRSSKNKSVEPTSKVFIQLDKDRKIDGVVKPNQWVSVSHTTKLDDDKWVFPSEKAKKKFLNDYRRKGKDVKLVPSGQIPLSHISFKNPILSDHHSRAFTKVAYNLVAYVLGYDVVISSLFDTTRQYILTGVGKVPIAYPDPQANFSPINQVGPLTYKTPYLPHYLSLTSTKDRRLLAMINIFGFNYVIVLCEGWENITHWLAYLYHADQYIECIPDFEFHKYLETDFWAIQLGPLFPLFSQSDKLLLSREDNYTEFLIDYLELDKINAG